MAKIGDTGKSVSINFRAFLSPGVDMATCMKLQSVVATLEKQSHEGTLTENTESLLKAFQLVSMVLTK